MTKFANLYAQLTEDGENAKTSVLNIRIVAELVGLHYDHESGATFRNALRDTPAIEDGGFTMGRAARAYMVQRIKWLDAI